ncbi:2-dehydropantoate 2-reductase [Pseudoroseomonas deserti]|uniref:2-dehydropantoate 2-reductase n=1 Tax=Teichococcus deserti TaxID=1817963 RepID=A0A1V2GVK9_9PROT|nr:ketopantoate reductase family protein [Pseudoroseomonas deserti]ONG45834.1 2-dehydropantoate 2-reductase [Pseudoroseomonas deserti]
MTRILVLGAGGIGGYFGGRLAQAGADVTFLVRPARQAALAQGLTLLSPFGDATIPVRSITADSAPEQFDLVLLTCKAYDLEAAIAAVAPFLDEGGAVLPLLNGIAHMERLNAAFGAGRVLGGSARIQATQTPEGAIRQFNDWRFLTVGEQDGRMSARATGFAALFDKAVGAECEAVPDILQRLWEKLVHLSTAAAMTCLMRANVGEILAAEDGAALFAETLQQSAAIAAAAGHPPSDTFMASYGKIFSDRSSQYATSMLRDVERGGPTEAEHIIGFMHRRAVAAGIAAPVLRMALVHLQAYAARREAGRL